MNIYQKLALALVGSSLSLGALGTIPATAAVLTYNFKFKEMNGSDGYGSFSFNSSDLQGKPYENVSLLSFTLNLWGNTLTKLQFSGGGVYFREGSFRGLNGSIGGYDQSCMNSAPNPYAQAYCQFSGSFGAYENYTDPNQPYYVFMGHKGRESVYYTPSYEQVPEPSAIGALLGLGIFKWNQSRRKQVNKASN